VTPPAPLLAQPTSDAVVVAGRRVCVLTAGTGEPLLYLHGVGDLGGWLPALAGLAERFAVVRPDHAGFNGSDDDPAVTTVAGLAARTLELLDVLGLPRVHVVGTSLGGWVGAELALLAPERVGRLVLVDPAGLDGATAAPSMFDLDPAELTARTCGDAESQAAGRARAAAVDADPALAARRARNAATALRLGGRALRDPGLAARLAGLRVPALVVWGALDRLLPVALGDEWAAAVPGARLHVVAGAGHLPPVDRPAEFVALVGDFLTGGDRR
jgi:pimeloyl-ACP methyl ester carboxylesterase